MQKKSVKFNKVAIVGTGLIGGSLGLALKKKKIAKRIVGFARHNRTLSLAKKIGAIDIGSRDLKATQDADLIVLATPVSAIINTAKQLSKIVKKLIGSSFLPILPALTGRFAGRSCVRFPFLITPIISAHHRNCALLLAQTDQHHIQESFVLVWFSPPRSM